MSEDIQQRLIQLNQHVLQLYQQGRYEQAIPLATQACDLSRQHLVPNHPTVATSINNLAVLYRAMGNYAQAEPLYQQALEIDCTARGSAHPDVAASLRNLAELYRVMSNYAQAESLIQQALEIQRTALGSAHPAVAAGLHNLAVLYAATGRPTEGLALMEQATAIDDRMLGQSFSIGSESQRMAYMKTVESNVDIFLSLVLQHLPHAPVAVWAALELVLRRKAIGAEALAAQRDAVLGGRYPELAPQLQALTTLRRQIAQKTLAGPGPEGLPAHQQLLAEWNAQKERLEAELAQGIAEKNLERQLRHVDRQVVAWALPEGGALVEFVRFNVFDFTAVPSQGQPQWQPARYLAFVLPAGAPDQAQMIDVGEAEPIDQMIATFRATITGKTENRNGRDLGAVSEAPERRAHANAGVVLRAALFDPLIAALGGSQRLLLAPDGALTRLPFEVLPMDNGRLLLDVYHLSYLSTGRDVLRFGATTAGQPAPPLVVADPDFDLVDGMSPAQQPRRDMPLPLPATPTKGLWSRLSGRRSATSPIPTVHGAQTQPRQAAAARRGTPNRQSRDLDRGTLHFGRLPGTRQEGEQIAALLDVSPWTTNTALEGRLKASRSPHILHIATHGFFLADQPHTPPTTQHDLGAAGWPLEDSPGRLLGPGLENPLLRSGLALAGVNTWLRRGTPPSEAEDGLLTAEDVTGMDLLDTELVTLSACETGLGDVRTGEGVFGLRRAFVLAGAKTLVMSLWKVPDQQTQELMEQFYRRVLAGQPRAAALREAQLAMQAKYPDPFYWGAFICQGDPGPLRQHRRIYSTATVMGRHLRLIK